MHKILLVLFLVGFANATDKHFNSMAIPATAFAVVWHQQYNQETWVNSAQSIMAFSTAFNFMLLTSDRSPDDFYQRTALSVIGILISYPIRYKNFELSGTSITYRF